MKIISEKHYSSVSGGVWISEILMYRMARESAGPVIENVILPQSSDPVPVVLHDIYRTGLVYHQLPE